MLGICLAYFGSSDPRPHLGVWVVEEEEVGRVTHLGPLDVEGEELHLAAVEAIQVGLEHRLAHLGDQG